MLHITFCSFTKTMFEINSRPPRERINIVTSDSAKQHSEINSFSARLLHRALAATDSAYGFIGPVVEGGPQGKIMRVLADEGFSWDPSVNRALYDKVRLDYGQLGYIDFPYLDNLFGWPIKHSKTIISNEPHGDYRRSGRKPAGHPPLNNFLGVPIMHGTDVVGTIGLANRTSGYSEELGAIIAQIGSEASALYEYYRRGIREFEAENKRRELDEYSKQLAQRLLDLAYTVSHELQGPTRRLESQLRLLSSRYKDRLGTDADEYIKESLVASAQMARMVDDLWTYARVDSPTNTIEAIDLNQTLSSATQSLNKLIFDKTATVSSTTLPQVKGVTRQMQYLFEQLIANGIQFNENPVPTVEVSAQKLVDEWIIEFRDNGTGFNVEELPQLLKMFNKNPKSVGTGMGLPIAATIVQYHGGRLWADSVHGRGSSWFFSLPDRQFGWQNSG